MVGVGTAGPLGTRRPAGEENGPERVLLAALAVADGIGPRRLAELLACHGSSVAVVDAARAPRARSARRSTRGAAAGPRGPDPMGLEPDLAGRVVEAAGEADRLAEAVTSLGLAILTLDDPAYPPRLRRIDLPPPVLFVHGSPGALGESAAVAVVGTRRPTEAGRRAAARIAGGLSRAGATIVSGLALGIDGMAHRACLDESGRTVAVLGSGHAELTPRLHRRLAVSIAERGGAVVSEFAPWREPAPWSFPRRNRLISGLADATVVVEAGVGSGALITAGWALEQGRDCFLVPGPLDGAASAGNLHFLREHHGLARIVADLGSLLADLGLDRSEASARPPELGELGPTAVSVARQLGIGDATVDELARVLDLAPATVLATLARLEMAGLVIQGIGRYRAAGLLASRSGGPSGTTRGPRPGVAA
jgi:DNA processing protein